MHALILAPDNMAPDPALHSADDYALIETLYHTLSSPDERYVFDAISAFAPCGAPISTIADITSLTIEACTRLLAGLQMVSLVQHDRDADCYRLHPLFYRFSRAELQERQTRAINDGVRFEDTLIGRMIHFYVRYTATNQDTFSALDTAHDNILNAATHASENNAWEAVYQLWEASELWLDITGDWNSLSFLIEWAVHASRIRETHRIQLAKALLSRSTYLDLKGQVNGAMRDAEEALALAYEFGDHKTIASALVRVSSLYSDYLNDATKAHDGFEEAWRLCQDIPHWDETAYIAYKLAQSYWSRDDLTTAKDLFEKSIAMSQRFFPHRLSLRYEGYCITSLGNLSAEQDDYEQARALLARSLELKAGDHYGTAISIKSVAGLERRLENFETALTLLKDALRMYQALGALSDSLRTLCDIGALYSRQLNYTNAIAAYEDAKHLGVRLDIPRDLAAALSGLGAAYYKFGRYDQALAALHECLRTLAATSEQDRYPIGVALNDIGKVYYRQGHRTEARAYFAKAKEQLPERDATRIVADALLQIGEEYTERGDHDAALIAYQEGLEMARLPSSADSDDYRKGVFLYKIGNQYAAMGLYNEAVTHLEQAYQTLKDKADPLELAVVLEYLETASKKAQLTDKASTARKLVEELLADAGSSANIETLIDLGDYFIGRDKSDDAKRVFDRVTTMLDEEESGERKNEPIRSLGQSYHSLGRLFDGEGRTQEALASYQRAAQLLKSRVRAQVYGVLMHDIADAYRVLRQPEEAIMYYEKALEYKERLRDISVTLRALADVYAEQGQHEKALAAYKEGLEKLNSLS